MSNSRAIISSTALAVAIGDLNGDGKPESFTSGNNTLEIWNNVGGSLQVPKTYDLSGDLNCLAVADLNGDGVLDIAVQDGGRVEVLFGVAASVKPASGPAIFGVLNAASSDPVIAPGSFVSIYWRDLAPVTVDWNSAGNGAKTLLTQMGGVSVTIDGRMSYLAYVSPTQINVLAPQDEKVFYNYAVSVTISNAQI